jgi:hypothetical protein
MYHFRLQFRNYCLSINEKVILNILSLYKHVSLNASLLQNENYCTLDLLCENGLLEKFRVYET